MRKKLALSAASILITLLFAEIALRILWIGAIGRGSPWFAGGNHPRYLFQPDPSGYTLRPGFQGREIAQSKEFDVPVAIDGQGLRAQPHAAPPRPRVLALGDSMTFGEGVPADATWPAALERTLGVRVDNAGVPGYSSAQMVGRLRRYLPLLQPKVVVMLLSPTWDLGRCASPFVYKGGYIVGQGYVDRLVLLDGNLYLRETKLPVLGTATAYAERYSNLARVALPSLAAADSAWSCRPWESDRVRATSRALWLAYWSRTLAPVESVLDCPFELVHSFERKAVYELKLVQEHTHAMRQFHRLQLHRNNGFLQRVRESDLSPHIPGVNRLLTDKDDDQATLLQPLFENRIPFRATRDSPIVPDFVSPFRQSPKDGGNPEMISSLVTNEYIVSRRIPYRLRSPGWPLYSRNLFRLVRKRFDVDETA